MLITSPTTEPDQPAASPIAARIRLSPATPAAAGGAQVRLRASPTTAISPATPSTTPAMAGPTDASPVTVPMFISEKRASTTAAAQRRKLMSDSPSMPGPDVRPWHRWLASRCSRAQGVGSRSAREIVPARAAALPKNAHASRNEQGLADGGALLDAAVRGGGLRQRVHLADKGLKMQRSGQVGAVPLR